MRHLVIIVTLLMGLHTVHAELRGILLEITSLTKPVSVNVYSDVQSERQRNASIESAARVLRDARGWKSSVLIEIVFRGALQTKDVISLLEAMKSNPDAMLYCVVSAESAQGKSLLKDFTNRISSHDK